MTSREVVVKLFGEDHEEHTAESKIMDSLGMVVTCAPCGQARKILLTDKDYVNLVTACACVPDAASLIPKVEKKKVIR